MAFDYKKEYKEFYMPKGTPSIVTVPKMNYIAVRGSGNPNDAIPYRSPIACLYSPSASFGLMDISIMSCRH